MYSFQTRGNMDTQEKISTVFDRLKELVLEKNKRYGDSALNPINIFIKDPNFNNSNSICQRANDKISRIYNSKELRKSDICDLIGYLCLLCIDKNWTDFKDQID